MQEGLARRVYPKIRLILHLLEVNVAQFSAEIVPIQATVADALHALAVVVEILQLLAIKRRLFRHRQEAKMATVVLVLVEVSLGEVFVQFLRVIVIRELVVMVVIRLDYSHLAIRVARNIGQLLVGALDF